MYNLTHKKYIQTDVVECKERSIGEKKGGLYYLKKMREGPKNGMSNASSDNMQFQYAIIDYSYKLRYKTFPLYTCYLTLSAYVSFYAILSYNIKMHYFRDNYAFLRIYFRVDYSQLYLRL